tara:strand:+ start:177 stop:566 length:390 start_codon:yes stop_codon:yes gene_type:complete
MKKLSTIAVTAVAVLMLSADRTDARPQYKSYFEKGVVAKSKNADFVTAAKEKKCNICHFGTKKSDRNDFGKALAKYTTKAGYLEKKADATVLRKYFDDGLKKVLEIKNPEGEKYGERINAGKLPGSIEK